MKVHIVRKSNSKFWQLRWREGGKLFARSSGTADKREARQAAKALEERLAGPSTAWDEFKQRCLQEHLRSLSQRTIEEAEGAWRHVERELSPQSLLDLTSESLSRMFSRLREGRSPDTLNKIRSHLRATLSWAQRVGMLSEVPRIDRQKRARGSRGMKGRPLTDREYRHYRWCLPDLRQDDWQVWDELVEMLWLSGLRLGSALSLSWSAGPQQVSVDLSAGTPLLRAPAASHKGARDEFVPVAPDFAAWLSSRSGTGRVLSIEIGYDRVKHVLGELGRMAGLDCSAHDLRRSFGTRWSRHVRPAVLMRMMQHRDISTTMTYYVADDAAQLSAEIASSVGRAPHEEVTPAGGVMTADDDSGSAARRKSLQDKSQRRESNPQPPHYETD